MDELDKFVYKVLGALSLLFAGVYIAYIETKNPFVFIVGMLLTLPISNVLSKELRKFSRETKAYLRDFVVANISFFFGLMMGLFFGSL